MTGFDSETIRRDAIRKQIVDTAVAKVHEIITKNAQTNTAEEFSYLELAIAAKLIEDQRRMAMSVMMRQEAKTAMKEIEGQ